MKPWRPRPRARPHRHPNPPHPPPPRIRPGDRWGRGINGVAGDKWGRESNRTDYHKKHPSDTNLTATVLPCFLAFSMMLHSLRLCLPIPSRTRHPRAHPQLGAVDGFCPLSPPRRAAAPMPPFCPSSALFENGSDLSWVWASARLSARTQSIPSLEALRSCATTYCAPTRIRFFAWGRLIKTARATLTRAARRHPAD